ncbi:MAG: acyl-CoA dehydrogenase family protein [Alphaproteobacteria bacterium]|nr:acyl-CoA dehydrogenase family protein [Alphaproteobacteria bacterium]MBL7096667.1 acyl-CoA dehydrogenase family protein [Alphaproteobacteria bacterium]
MDLSWSDTDLRFRDEVHAFLDAELTPDLRKAGKSLTSVYADYDVTMEWHRILYKKGWVAPAWPKEFGGTGWNVVQRFIWASETASAGAPPLSPMGLGMCGPVIIGHGTPAQKAHYLPRMLSGEDFWCQGYSEPGSGSDLASLQMSAKDAGAHFVCNGHKIWTTHAHLANWIFCLVRTSKEDIPQRGITFLLIDMKSPGVTVKPIVFASGEAVQNEVFFTDVKVPKANVVGRVGDGWTVAKYLMLFERGGGTSAPSHRVRLSRIREIARAEGNDDPEFAAKVADAAIQVEAMGAMELRTMSALSSGQAPGPESSMLKMVSTDLSQRLTELALEAVGYYAMPFQPFTVATGGPTPGFHRLSNQEPVGPEYSWPVMAKYLNDRAGSIYAGTNEVQRNILAKAVLGL